MCAENDGSKMLCWYFRVICRPGDAVIVSGIFPPKPYVGYKKIKTGLITYTYLRPKYIGYVKQKLVVEQNTTEHEDITGSFCYTHRKVLEVI